MMETIIMPFSGWRTQLEVVQDGMKLIGHGEWLTQTFTGLPKGYSSQLYY